MLRWAAIFFVIAIVAAIFGFGGIALQGVDTAQEIVRRSKTRVALDGLFSVGEGGAHAGGVEPELGELVVGEAEARIEFQSALQGGLRGVGIGEIRMSEAEQVRDFRIRRVLTSGLCEAGERGGIVAGFEIGIAE